LSIVDCLLSTFGKLYFPSRSLNLLVRLLSYDSHVLSSQLTAIRSLLGLDLYR
jgi:hypothetical protein